MLLRTKRNGGEASLKEVAAAWKKEAHDFAWSQSEADSWVVEFARRMHELELKAGPAKPDPRNVHPG